MYVQEHKTEYEHRTTDELEVIVAELDRTRKRLDLEKRANQARLEAATAVLLTRWEDNGNTQQVKRDSVGTLSRIDGVYASITDLPAFKTWTEDRGISGLVKETVNARSLASLMKDLLTEGEPLPESVKIFTESRIRVSSQQYEIEE